MTCFAPVEKNLRACFQALAAGREASETLVTRGIHILSLGVRFQMFNAAFLHSPVENSADFELRVSRAAVHFRARGIPWSFWLCDDLLQGPVLRRAHPILARYDLSLATQMPAMLATGLRSPLRALPPCEIREVKCAATLDDFRSIGARCFRVPPDWFSEVFDAETPRRLPFRAWVGYFAGEPVTTAATVRTPDSLGLYNIASHPDRRNKGHAEALLRAAISAESLSEETADPVPLVLQSTHAGLSLYRSLGFQEVGQFRVWVSR